VVSQKAIQRRFDEILSERWRRGYSNGDANARVTLWDQARRDVERQEAAERAAAAQREQSRRDSIRRALTPTTDTRTRADGYTQVVESFAREFGISVEWRAARAMPAGVRGVANIRKRHVMVPRIEGSADEVEVAFGICLHELGHCLEPCSGPDHRYVKSPLGRGGACLACEAAASKSALSSWPLSKVAFGLLSDSLKAYRSAYSGPPSAIKALEKQASTLAWAESRQSHVRRSLDVMRWEHEQRLLSPQERLERRIKLQRAEVEDMRARRARKG